MYRSDIFRSHNSRVKTNDGRLFKNVLHNNLTHGEVLASSGCRHDEVEGVCEHISLSDCIRVRRNGTQLIATGLVINWEGCELQTNASKCLWELSRSIAEDSN